MEEIVALEQDKLLSEDEKTLALEIAQELAPQFGEGLVSETKIAQDVDLTRDVSIIMGAGGLLFQALSFAYSFYKDSKKEADRTQLYMTFLEEMAIKNQEWLNKKRRINDDQHFAIISKVCDEIPKRFGMGPLFPAETDRSKQEWAQEWSSANTRRASPTILMPFACMKKFIVYKDIHWTPPEGADETFPRQITVPRGFITDLASVPPYFAWAVPPTGQHGHAAILHDWLYWDQSTSRKVADDIFKLVMEEQNVEPALRNTLWAAVRLFGQKPWADWQTRHAENGKMIIKTFPDDTSVTWADWQKNADHFQTIS